MRISTKSTTNFEASGSTELIRSHHNVRDQWLLMQEPTKTHLDVQDQWLLMQGTKVQNKCVRKKVAKKLARHAFHVINETLFGSRGTSSANSLSSGSSRVSIPRFARFPEDSNLGTCINFCRKPTTNKQFPKCTCCIRVFCHNITQPCRRMTPTYCCSTLDETLFERKCLQSRFLVFQAKTRGRRASQGVVDTTTVHHQSSRNFVSLQISSFANPAVRTELLSSTNVCRQLRHRRLPLLESLLQMKILPPVSIDSNARISETCSIHGLAATRSLQ